MVTDDQLSSSYQYQGNSAKHCWWMLAGIVDYKLCDRDYDCEHCSFDDVLHGKDATRSAHSNDQKSGNLNNEQRSTQESCFRFPNVQGSEVRNDLFSIPAIPGRESKKAEPFEQDLIILGSVCWGEPTQLICLYPTRHCDAERSAGTSRIRPESPLWSRQSLEQSKRSIPG